MTKISVRMVKEALKKGEVWSRKIQAGQSTRFYRYDPEREVVEVGTVSLSYSPTYHLSALYRVELTVPVKEVA